MVPFEASFCAAADAPLESTTAVSACLRLATDGDSGAVGSEGGVRVPLAAAMVMKGAIRDARAVLQRAQDGRVRVGASNMPSARQARSVRA